MKRIAILGTGISGLAAAHHVRELSDRDKDPVEIILVDRAKEPGGSIRTRMRDGFLMEEGPDSFISDKLGAIKLSERLGLTSELLPTQSEFRRTWVAHHNKLHSLPEGFYLIAPRSLWPFFKTPLFSWSGKMRMAAEMLVPKDKTGADESVSSFICRRFGREALNRVGQPMIAGVYSGDPDRLSILSTMPRFRELEAKHGSVIRGLRHASHPAGRMAVQGPRYSLFMSYDSGMQTLPRALQGRLSDATWNLGYEAEEIHFDTNASQWVIRGSDRPPIVADALCLALSGSGTSRLVRNVFPKLAEKLNSISYESVATINFAFEESQISHRMDGFGFVIPKTENKSLMACSFSHRKFKGRAPKGGALLRAFVGGAFGKKVLEMDDEEMVNTVSKDLDVYLGVRGKPIFTTLSRYANALPQYEVGHSILIRRVERESSLLPLCVLAGSSYRGTGIPDCIADGETQVEALWKEWRSKRV